MVYPDVPLNANMQNAINTGKFFTQYFSNLAFSIPVTILSTVLSFLIIYLIFQWRFRYVISRKVKKLNTNSAPSSKGNTLAL